MGVELKKKRKKKVWNHGQNQKPQKPSFSFIKGFSYSSLIPIRVGVYEFVAVVIVIVIITIIIVVVL